VKPPAHSATAPSSRNVPSYLLYRKKPMAAQHAVSHVADHEAEHEREREED